MFLRHPAILLFVLMISLAMPARADFTDDFELFEEPQNLPAVLFKDDKGRDRDLKDYKGRYVLLNLWATWCKPCIKEMPSLYELQKKFDPKVLTVIALVEDRDGLVAAQSFYRRHMPSGHLPILIDDTGRVPGILKVRGLPTTFLIAPDGRAIGKIVGDADWSAPATIAFLEAKMKK